MNRRWFAKAILLTIIWQLYGVKPTVSNQQNNGIIDKSVFDNILSINRQYHGNNALFEGDLMLQKHQSKSRSKRNIEETKIWEDVNIPFYISADVPIPQKLAIYQAVAELKQVSCINLIEYNIWTIHYQANYIIFVYGNGCFSDSVGQKGGKQEISIGPLCAYTGIVIHELLHALGFWHTHSRPDRDQYINVFLENVISGKEGNFAIHSETTMLGFPYDFKSLLHYGPSAFTSNGKVTIAPKDPEVNLTENTIMSDLDIAQLNALYCDDRIPATTSGTSHTSTTTQEKSSTTTVAARTSSGASQTSSFKTTVFPLHETTTTTPTMTTTTPEKSATSTTKSMTSTTKSMTKPTTTTTTSESSTTESTTTTTLEKPTLFPLTETNTANPTTTNTKVTTTNNPTTTTTTPKTTPTKSTTTTTKSTTESTSTITKPTSELVTETKPTAEVLETSVPIETTSTTTKS